ncbi:hypothetical protein KCP73_04595 [Salmonella enterica subsp. enterica]|nr:hypothetical protein KCP73_04595 [Salmonella enterica subsp. enterica]
MRRAKRSDAERAAEGCICYRSIADPLQFCKAGETVSKVSAPEMPDAPLFLQLGDVLKRRIAALMMQRHSERSRNAAA